MFIDCFNVAAKASRLKSANNFKKIPKLQVKVGVSAVRLFSYPVFTCLIGHMLIVAFLIGIKTASDILCHI